MPSAWERSLRPQPAPSSPAGLSRMSGGERLIAARLEREDQARQKKAEQDRLDREAQARLRAQYGEQSMFPGSGSAGVRPTPTAEGQAEARARLRDFVLGPERRSVFGGEAGPRERVIRDWGLSEQEFRTAGERAGEGRFRAAAGWAGLGLAGAIPFFGNAAQVAGKLGRASGTAADVARAADVAPRPMVFADNIADDFINERFYGTELFSNRKPNIESVPLGRRDVAELAYRQGFEAPPRVVDSQTFNSLPAGRATVARERLPLQHPNAPDDVIIYRGFEGEHARSDNFNVLKTSEDYANEFMSGEYYVGFGVRGHGTYFSANPIEAINYTGYESAQYLALKGSNAQDYLGSVVRARIAPEARLLDGFSDSTRMAFEQSRFKDISEFAAANGYDGIRYSFNPDKPSLDNIVILNRSALTLDKKIARIDAEAAIGFSENWRNVERFSDTMFSDSPFLPPSLPRPPFGGIG